jgi:hypothetical protein
MVEDLPDHGRLFAYGDDLHGPAAARTEQRIDLVDLAEQTRPGPPGFQWHPTTLLGHGLHRGSLPEEPVPLPVASRPIGVPAVEERGLLVGIGDVGAHLGEEVQGIEHPEVRLVPRVDRV